jgi:putative transposase
MEKLYTLKEAKVLSNLYQVRAYNIKHNYDIKDFLEAYRIILQKAIDEIWNKIIWIERYLKGRRRLIPKIPKDNKFKNHYLRNLLMKDWNYSKHYVDSAIKQAYSIIKSWRRNYIKGERKRKKPIVKKRFVRIKETLYTYKKGKIKVSIKPYEEYLEFDISKAWFLSRVKGEMGELILNENYLTITFRLKRNEEVKGKIAWDCNEKSLDGFNLNTGWVKVDLTKLFHIHRVYELKRKRLQKKASKKNSLIKVLKKYSKKERNRSKDFIHKLTTFITRKFDSYIHGFEDLRKNRMFTSSKEHNRKISKNDWKTIIKFMSYKSKIILLNPKNSTKRCSRCGMINAPKGAIYECKCGLRINRQLNAAINLYLQMEGLSPSPKLFNELMKRWSGFNLTGEEANERANELKRSLRLMNPKSYVGLFKTT